MPKLKPIVTEEQRTRIEQLAKMRNSHQAARKVCKAKVATSKIKIVKACPACDKSRLHHYKRTNNYYCYTCKSVFTEPVVRQSKTDRKSLEPADDVKACPNCDSYETIYDTQKEIFYCSACGKQFKKLKIHPKIRSQQLRANLTTDEWWAIKMEKAKARWRAKFGGDQ